MNAQTWTAVLRPADGTARGRVVAFPHAGAGPNALLPVLKLLPSTVEVVGVTLPGRERRFGEALPDVPDLGGPQDVARAVVGELRRMPVLPTVYFGHSMGSVLASAVSLEAPELCEGLVLSASPHSGTRAGQLRTEAWDEAALLDVLRRGGGTPSEVLTVPFLREHVLNLLRYDLTLGALLGHRNAGRVPPVPVTVLTGEDDALVTAAVPTVPAKRQRAFPGGHFYLLDHVNSDAVAAEIVASFAQPRNGDIPLGEGARAPLVSGVEASSSSGATPSTPSASPPRAGTRTSACLPPPVVYDPDRPRVDRNP